MQLGVEISGARVTALNVDVGQQVRKGEVLLELDHRSLDSELQQARAALAEAEAGVELARANLARGELLVKDKYISASQLDELPATRTRAERSEEHTSALQSLMRISYAVFCLKKKKKKLTSSRTK